MGMNQPGEISRLSQMACPDIAMVINTAGVHLEGLGSVENVARAKAEIFKGVQNDGTAILFSSDPRRDILQAGVKENPGIKTLVLFGPDLHADVQASDIRADADGTHFTARFDGRLTPFTIHSPALFMVDNCLAAICAARAAGIDVDGMQKGIRAFTPVPGRMSLMTLETGLHVIDDTYNANPVSMAQALFTLHRLSHGKKCIAVLGDMLELGAASETLHRQIGEQIARLDISKLYVAGNQVQFLVEEAIQKGYPRDRIFHGTKEAMVDKILADTEKDSWVLVKGSRGMAMEKVIQGLKQKRTVNF
jgi:murE/murF fusion protein